MVITFPFGVVLNVRISDAVKLYPMDFFAACIIVYTAFVYTYRYVSLDPLIKAVLLFVAVGILSLLVNSFWLGFEMTFVASMYLLRFVMYTGIIVALSMVTKEFAYRYLKILIYGAGGLFTALGFVQYFYYPYLGNLLYLGWDEHYYRMFSTVLDPNFAGTIFLLILLGICFTWSNKKNIYWHIFTGISFMASAVALFLTYSRTTYIMALTTLLLYCLLKRNIKIFLVLLLIFIAGVIFIPKNRSSEGVDLLRMTSVVQRFENVEKALTIFSRHPILGVGFNSYRYAQQKEQLYSPPPNYVLYDNSAAGVSNSYIFVLVTTGVVGFVVFIYFLMNIYRTIRRVAVKDQRLYELVLLSCFAVGVGSLFENLFFYTTIMFWIFSLIGICMAVLQKKSIKART